MTIRLTLFPYFHFYFFNEKNLGPAKYFFSSISQKSYKDIKFQWRPLVLASILSRTTLGLHPCMYTHVEKLKTSTTACTIYILSFKVENVGCLPNINNYIVYHTKVNTWRPPPCLGENSNITHISWAF